MKKKTALAALILLPAFFLLHNFNELYRFIPVRDLIFYGSIIYGALTLGYIILLISKVSTEKAVLILFALSVIILFFTPIHKAYRTLTFNSILSHFWVMLMLLILVLIVLIKKIIRSENISPKIPRFLNVVMVCLIATELIISIQKESIFKKDHNLIYPGRPLSQNYIPSNQPDSSKPDIYFFVFDEYTNNETLKKMWNFDNSGITQWLNNKGFFTPRNSRCNYSFTVFSVSSTFNMNYIDKNRGQDGTIATNVMKANQSLSDNETFRILKKENYSIDFISPFRNSIKENSLGHFFDYLIDEQIPSQTLPGSFRIAILSKINSSKLLYRRDSLEYEATIKEKCQTINNTVKQVELTTDSSNNRKPHFVYGHILVPHVPHIFDSSGGYLTYHDYISKSLFETYTFQVSYANKIIKELVGYIQEHNKHNTIIIIEGDHGFRHFTGSQESDMLPNFNAIFFPDRNYSMLYDTISPVNTFRIVFDQFFQQKFPLLKDSSTIVNDYFYTNL